MKIKVDENLARAHRRVLDEAGHDVADVHDVHEEGLVGASDDVLWTHVCEEGRLLVTLDTDFSDVRRFLPDTHLGILLMRTTHPGVSAISKILRRVLEERVTSARVFERGIEHRSICLREVLHATMSQEHAWLRPRLDFTASQRDRIDLERVRDLVELRRGESGLAGLDRLDRGGIDAKVAGAEPLTGSLGCDRGADLLYRVDVIHARR